MSENQGKQPAFFFDNEPQQWPNPTVTGKELRDKFKVPSTVQIFQKIAGKKDREILDDTIVDLTAKGPERFSTQAVGSGAGLQPAGKLLLEEDYAHLDQCGMAWEEDSNTRCFVFKGFLLPVGVYTVERADVLVQIPGNYNHDGIDMLWLSPRLTRVDGKEVPAQATVGSGMNVHHGGAEFCRWSRHWNAAHNAWRPGVDSIETILRRVDWALAHPDAEPSR